MLEKIHNKLSRITDKLIFWSAIAIFVLWLLAMYSILKQLVNFWGVL